MPLRGFIKITMIFDKNQNIFPSDFHREIWWWAIGLVPPCVSLTDEVKGKCGEDVLEGCHQWYDYFCELCGDMYINADVYAPVRARQYRDLLENIAGGGEISGDLIVWDLTDWQKYIEKQNKSKAYAASGITAEHCLKVLERTGLKCEYSGNAAIFKNEKYPKIFRAMSVFEKSPNIRKTPARHHFAHCEFRQLFKSYSASYDELLRRVNEESLDIAHSIHDFAKSLKIQRYIHFDTIKYKHKNVRVLDFGIHGDQSPALRVNIGTCANFDADISNDAYYKCLANADAATKEIFIKNLTKCENQSHSRQSIIINGKKEQICPCSRVQINPFKKDLEAIFCFIDARKASIDQNSY